MRVELKTEYCSQNPDDIPILAARGDYLDTSLIGKDVEDVLEDIDVEKADGDDLESKKRGFLEKIVRRGHYGVFEHPQLYFAVEGISRTCMAQLTRHRHASFDVQSQRYVNFENATPVIPESFKGGDILTEYDDVEWDASRELEDHFEYSTKIYQRMVDAGIPKEDARFILPLSTKVNLSFSMNVRSFFHVVDMRWAGDSQWEIRELAEKLVNEFEEYAPLTAEVYLEYGKGDSKKAP